MLCRGSPQVELLSRRIWQRLAEQAKGLRELMDISEERVTQYNDNDIATVSAGRGCHTCVFTMATPSAVLSHLSWSVQRVEAVLVSAVEHDPQNPVLNMFVAQHIAVHRDNNSVEKIYLNAALVRCLFTVNAVPYRWFFTVCTARPHPVSFLMSCFHRTRTRPWMWSSLCTAAAERSKPQWRQTSWACQRPW